MRLPMPFLTHYLGYGNWDARSRGMAPKLLRAVQNQQMQRVHGPRSSVGCVISVVVYRKRDIQAGNMSVAGLECLLGRGGGHEDDAVNDAVSELPGTTLQRVPSHVVVIPTS